MKNRPGPDFFRRGFTLIEMVLSLVIVGIILAAVESLIVLSARSIDNGTSITARAAAGRWASDQFLADVRLATAMTSTTANQMSFSVPDRAGGTGTNTVSYTWAGVGSPLNRSVNGGNSVALASNVQAMNLTVQTATATPAGAVPAVPTTTAESVLLSYDTSSNGSLTTSRAVTPSNYAGYAFKPVLSGTPMYWSLTHLKLLLARTSILSVGTVTVEIHSVDASLHPTATVLDTSTALDISLLSTSAVWDNFSFTNLTAMDPTQPYAVVVKGSGLLCSVNLVYDYKTGSPANSLLSTSSGGAWTNVSPGIADIYVYGTVTNP